MKIALFTMLLVINLLLDMHVHTSFSKDACLSVKTLFRVYSLKNIVPAITDHNNCNAWQHAKDFAKKYNHLFVPGEEIKVYYEGKLIGELLGFFMNECVAPGNVFEVIDKLREQDALISIAHPFDIFRKPFKKLELVLDKVDMIEIFNSRCYLNRFNEKAKELAELKKMPFTAGTDAHFKFELGKAFMICDASSLEEARKKLLKRKCTYFGKRNGFKGHFFTWLRKLGVLSA